MTDLSDVLGRLSSTPEQLKELLDGLSDLQLRWKPSSQQFSILETVCHLRDIESDGYRIRMNRLLEDDDPQLRDIDGARLAVERRYQDTRDVNIPLRDFTKTRSDNVDRLSRTTPDELHRSGELERVGSITLRDLIDVMLGHDSDHLDAIRELRETAPRPQSTLPGAQPRA